MALGTVPGQWPEDEPSPPPSPVALTPVRHSGTFTVPDYTPSDLSDYSDLPPSATFAPPNTPVRHSGTFRVPDSTPSPSTPIRQSTTARVPHPIPSPKPHPTTSSLATPSSVTIRASKQLLEARLDHTERELCKFSRQTHGLVPTMRAKNDLNAIRIARDVSIYEAARVLLYIRSKFPPYEPEKEAVETKPIIKRTILTPKTRLTRSMSHPNWFVPYSTWIPLSPQPYSTPNEYPTTPPSAYVTPRQYPSDPLPSPRIRPRQLSSRIPKNPFGSPEVQRTSDASSTPKAWLKRKDSSAAEDEDANASKKTRHVPSVAEAEDANASKKKLHVRFNERVRKKNLGSSPGLGNSPETYIPLKGSNPVVDPAFTSPKSRAAEIVEQGAESPSDSTHNVNQSGQTHASVNGQDSVEKINSDALTQQQEIKTSEIDQQATGATNEISTDVNLPGTFPPELDSTENIQKSLSTTDNAEQNVSPTENVNHAIADGHVTDDGQQASDATVDAAPVSGEDASPNNDAQNIVLGGLIDEEQTISPNLKRKITESASPDDAEMEDLSPKEIRKRMRRGRRVHFQDAAFSIAFHEGYANVAPSAREFYIGGMAGAPCPSPYWRSPFQNFHVLDETNHTESPDQDMADSSPVSRFAVPNSPAPNMSPMNAAPLRDPTSPSPAPRQRAAVIPSMGQPTHSHTQAVDQPVPSTNTVQSSARSGNNGDTTNQYNRVIKVPKSRKAKARRVLSDVTNTAPTGPQAPGVQVTSPKAHVSAPASSPNKEAIATNVANDSAAGASANPENNNSNDGTDYAAPNEPAIEATSIYKASTIQRLDLSIKRTINEYGFQGLLPKKAYEVVRRKVSEEDLDEITQDMEQLLGPSSERLSLIKARDEESTTAKEGLNAAAEAAAAHVREAEEKKKREEEAKAQEARAAEEKKLREEAELRTRESKRLLENVSSPLIAPLTPKWDEQVNRVLSRADPNGSVPGTNITRHDLSTLLPQSGAEGIGWLNDVIIEEYINKATQKAREKANPTGRVVETPPYYSFNSHLYTKWTDAVAAGKSPAEDVARWVRRARISGTNLLETEVVLIPINSGNHWTLIAISGKKRTITYYDSLGGSGDVYRQFASAFVRGILRTDYNGQEWKVLVGPSVRQLNGVDCGVFVCLNGLALIRGMEPHRAFVAQDLPAARRQIAATLINGGFNGDFDF